MFCLGCGSEITIRTDYCPVCGQRIGGEAKTAVALSPVVPLVSPPTPGVALMDMSDDADSSPAQRQGGEADTMPRLSVLTMQGSAHAAEAPVGGAAIGWGDLDGLAIPQDTPGRVTLAAAAALVASLFFPWLIINGQGIAPTQLGLSALLVVGAAVIVAAPALWRPRRRRQPAAALPFGLGACLLGVGIALWAVFGPFSNGLINALFSTVVVRGITSNIGTSSGNPGFQTSLSVGGGLYLFLLSAVALTIAGYFLLMDAVAVSASHAGATGVSGVGQLGSPMMSGVGVTPEVSGSTYGAPQSAPALPTTAQQPPAPNTPPLPGDLRWEQEIASPPAIRHPTFGGKLSAGRGSRH